MSRKRSDSLPRAVDGTQLSSYQSLKQKQHLVERKYSTLASPSAACRSEKKTRLELKLHKDARLCLPKVDVVDTPDAGTRCYSTNSLKHNEHLGSSACKTPKFPLIGSKNQPKTKLLNEPQESSVKVAVRLRSYMPNEEQPPTGREQDIRIKKNKVLVRTERSTVLNDPHSSLNMFEFDYAFDSTNYEKLDFASQEKVFRVIGEPILEYSLEGYNTCLFAYGQSGSGKTFTMMGTPSNPGIIRRMMLELFRQTFVRKHFQTRISISFLEIYQEKLYDLLVDEFDQCGSLRVRENSEMGVHIPKLTSVQVESYEEAMDQFNKGCDKRSTSETTLNIESSRSHAVFTITIIQESIPNADEDGGGDDVQKTLVSKIHLVDLAGSEKPKENDGQRFREGAAINKSLFTLGKVIDALAKNDKSQVIPYRESQLTFLLKDSLGGNSRTFMIATISPAKAHLEETLSTLRYASTASKIVNTVQVNQDPTSGYISTLLRQISFLKKKLNPQEDFEQSQTDLDNNDNSDAHQDHKVLNHRLHSVKKEYFSETPESSSPPSSLSDKENERFHYIIRKFKDSMNLLEENANKLRICRKELLDHTERCNKWELPSVKDNHLSSLQSLLNEMNNFRVEDHALDYRSYLQHPKVED